MYGGYLASKFKLRYTLKEYITICGEQFLKECSDLLVELIKDKIKDDLFIIFMNDHQFRPQEIDITNKANVMYIKTIVIRNYVNNLSETHHRTARVNYFEFLDYLKNTNWYKKTFIKNKKKQTKLQ